MSPTNTNTPTDIVFLKICMHNKDTTKIFIFSGILKYSFIPQNKTTRIDSDKKLHGQHRSKNILNFFTMTILNKY